MNELSGTIPADQPHTPGLPPPDTMQDDYDAARADEEGDEPQTDDTFSAAFDAVGAENETVFAELPDEANENDDTADPPVWMQIDTDHETSATAAGYATGLPDIPAQRATDVTPAVDAPATVATAADNDPGSGIRPEGGVERPRFDSDDLLPSGRIASGQTRELMTGPDGRDHFSGDQHDTFRDQAGNLRTLDGNFASDDNTADGTRHEAPQETISISLDATDLVDATFLDGVDDNLDAAANKDTLRTGTVEPLIDRMADAGVEADASLFTSSDAKYVEFRDKATDVLSEETLTEIDEARIQYRAADERLRASSERLGQLAGDVVTAKIFPEAIVVTGGKDEKGRTAEFDRVLFVEATTTAPAKLIFMEEKGGSARIDTRKVTDPADPTGPRVTARQCSPEYVREIAQIDATLAKAIRADPELGRALQQTITGSNSGNLHCYLVKGLPNGKIKMTEMLLAPLRLLRETIRLAGYQEGDQ